MRVLVLGATGCIGGQIARAAHTAGMQVHAMRRRPGAVGAAGDIPIVWHDGSLEDSECLAEAMRGCDVLFHAAAYAPGTERQIALVVRQGVAQLRGVLAAAQAAGIKRVIYTSSLATIGPPPAGSNRLADERDAYLPGSVNSSYYEVKWHMEHEALRATHAGLPVMILCPTAVFSPGDSKPSTSQLLLLLAQSRLPATVDVQVNFVDGRDVALAHIQAAAAGQPGQRYIIGGHNLDVREAMARAAAVIGVRPPRWHLSRAAMRRLLAVTDALRLPVTETMRTLLYWQPLNCEKGWQTFGLTPRPFEETVRDTYTWFKEHGYLKR